MTLENTLVWLVAHTRARCEKKVAQHCADAGIAAIVPCYKSIREYRSKKVTFEKPLFPGYVFIQAHPEQKAKILQSDHVANLLAVTDQELFREQLAAVLAALESGLEILLAPEIGKGMRVRVKNGPLAGLEGWVEERYGFDTVLLRLDFIAQAAAVKLTADDLEPI